MKNKQNMIKIIHKKAKYKAKYTHANGEIKAMLDGLSVRQQCEAKQLK